MFIEHCMVKGRVAGRHTHIQHLTAATSAIKWLVNNTCNPSPKKQPSILGHQRVIAGHYVVNRDRHNGLQVSCNSVRTIYKAVKFHGDKFE